MDIISFFSGCGGLDLGFQNAGFNIVWANEYDRITSETYKKNHADTILDPRSMLNIPIAEIPGNKIGIIGGPPCQSWSTAGKGRGITDKRGKLFLDYINIIKEKQPLFFLAENVAGMKDERNIEAYIQIKKAFEEAGYNVSAEVLNAADFDVPQNRKRLFFIGYRNDLNMEFTFPEPNKNKITVEKAISDLKDTALPAKKKNLTNGNLCSVPNNEYWIGGFSYIFMSRNRVLSWEGQSYTIQAQARQVSIHPQAPKMKLVEKDVMRFVHGKKKMYRRLTIRECARLQTFPDDFIFYYNNLSSAYKMIGNAVPVNLAEAIATKIYTDLHSLNTSKYFKCTQNLDLKQPMLVPV